MEKSFIERTRLATKIMVALQSQGLVVNQARDHAPEISDELIAAVDERIAKTESRPGIAPSVMRDVLLESSVDLLCENIRHEFSVRGRVDENDVFSAVDQASQLMGVMLETQVRPGAPDIATAIVHRRQETPGSVAVPENLGMPPSAYRP